MQTSPKGVAEIVGHEGIVLSPYRDSAGVWTFGVGHTAAAGAPDPAEMERGTRQPLGAALDLLRADLRRVEERVAKAVKVPLRTHEFDALVSFDFNTGGIFRAKLVRLLNEGDRAGAAEAFDGWHHPPEIIGRRDAEKRLFRDRVYAHGGMATLYAAGADGRVDWSSGTRINVGQLLAPGQPDDPGVPEDAPVPATPPSAGEGSLWAAVAAAFIAVFAFLAKLALWVAIATLIVGAGVLVWRYRSAIGGSFRRIGSGLRRLGGRRA